MATKDLNVERLMAKMTLPTTPSNPRHLSGKSVSVSAKSEAPIKRTGRPVSHADSGKWLDECTVTHRVGVPDPNVLPLGNICCTSENIGDYSNDTCNGEKADFLTLHGPVLAFAFFWGHRENTTHHFVNLSDTNQR